jgi:DNA-directed RNA polymerase subunit B'
MMTSVYLNGKYTGETKAVKDMIKSIKEMRRAGQLPEEMNISYSKDEDSVSLVMDKGRARRPLVVVENGKPTLMQEHIDKIKAGELKWKDLVKLGIIEYLDAGEEENALIAIDVSELTNDHTHVEISPTVIMGPEANMVPYAQHSLSYRITLGAKMTKQSLGMYATNLAVRADTDVSIIHYPQVPIVKTQMYDLIKFESHPAGQNVTVAVMPFDGYNMNDAVVISRASIDRGLFRATTFRPYKCEELKYPGGQADEIKIPDKDIKGFRTEAAYNMLQEDGIVAPETEVKSNDVLVGKISPPRFLASLEEFKVGTESQRETSTITIHSEEGIVDSVLISESEEGNKFVKVKVRDQRIPEIGDKFASRHGQKGVVGIIVPEEDMPFTADGIIPDIIFSPHSVPSRMTIGHLIELIGGKVGALTGKHIDATAFQSTGEFELRNTLKELGFREDGTETMYDGRTGEQLEARIFVGGQYYYRLRHMVAGKMHARSRGPVQLLTRQPTEGRAKEGGLRLGEMEKDCFVAHGAALLLKERFDSDRTIIPVCKKCGMIAVHNRFKNTDTCPIDGDDAPVTFIEMSYAFKLLLDELKSMCIYPRLIVKPKY